MAADSVGLATLLVASVGAIAWAMWRRRRDGRLRPGSHRGALASDELGVPLGEVATLVQFSTPYCQPCGPTRRMLAEICAETPGVARVEINAADRFELARRLGIRRTPTVLVLDSAGRERARVSGVPDRDAMVADLRLLQPALSDER